MDAVQSVFDDETIARLKAAHGGLVAVQGPSCKLVFRTPTRVEWERFVDDVSSERKSKAVSIRALAVACGVWPDAATIHAAFEKMPGIPSAIVDKLGELAGAGGTAEVEKL